MVANVDIKRWPAEWYSFCACFFFIMYIYAVCMLSGPYSFWMNFIRDFRGYIVFSCSLVDVVHHLCLNVIWIKWMSASILCSVCEKKLLAGISKTSSTLWTNAKIIHKMNMCVRRKKTVRIPSVSIWFSQYDDMREGLIYIYKLGKNNKDVVLDAFCSVQGKIYSE